MKATLIAKPTFCIPFLEGKSIEEGIIYLARITSEQQENDSYKGLLKYLMKEGHWSPFDMLNMVVEVTCERDVSRQILRHPFMPQEWSQRYGDASGMLVTEVRETRMQDTTNRQNSFPCDNPDIDRWWKEKQQDVIDNAANIYSCAINKGIAKEVARSILPEGLTTTKMYLNGSIRTYLFYLKARLHCSTQKEHMLLANEIKKLIEPLMPNLWLAFKEMYL